jgi:putative addiction module component (TIGR02574 family)
MNAGATIDKKIAGYLELLNERQKKAVLGIVKAFAEEETSDDIWQDAKFVAEIDRRTKELESGKVKGYSWDEVKKITRKSISEMKKK